MSTRRHLIAALVIAASNLPAASASACCLTDWLFGRTPVYTAGYAPVTVTNVPVVNAPYAAGYAPTPVTSRYQISGIYYPAQPPVYLNNPSVYTGMPVASQANYRGTLPVAPQQTLQPITAPTTSFYNGGNSYPTQTSASQYSSAYTPVTNTPVTSAPVTSAPVTNTSVTGLPMTAVPATSMAPLYQVAPQRPAGGLARFFGSLFGTNYQTSYYQAPVTYYRPVNTVDPISGTTVTTQQACSSYVDQIQRTPYSSLGATPPTTPIPQTYQANPNPSQGSYGPVGQVGAVVGPNDRSVVPIPSSNAYPGSNPFQSQNYATPNTAPLTGSPAYGQQPNYSQPNDSAPLEQPRLESARPVLTPPSISAPSMAPPSWQLQNPADSNVFGSSSSASSTLSANGSDRMVSAYGPQPKSDSNYSSLSPIQAPPNYQSPFKRESLNFNQSSDNPNASPFAESPSTHSVAPQLPSGANQSSGSSSRDQMISHIPVREAALPRQNAYRQQVIQTSGYSETRPATSRKTRDSSGWYSLNP
ncbi:hypothetical protein Q31b_31000 [Novipirellula aureliae]|uniref:Uncharacterized protein n=1 Tax=Novipirellula aureliae TaxID=2527966 RepID=A0A5C6E2P1_9BACT|nr:hypothetical protein [Novipirellula aureliae]TWU41646.1 hypothetical protein Q31b_31000 [Novipirellula aureliae]